MISIENEFFPSYGQWLENNNYRPVWLYMQDIEMKPQYKEWLIQKEEFELDKRLRIIERRLETNGVRKK